MKKLSMYMVTHKNVDYIPEGRIPIFVGNGDNVSNFIRDNTGESISDKNKYFCELTAFYWIWKNDRNADYVSVEHYRRFFMEKNISPLKKEKVIKYLNKNDGIVTKKYKFKTSIKEYYAINHIASDLSKVEDAIENLYPEYMDSYNKIMNGKDSSMCNMLILKKNDFDMYCEWLFNILFYVERKINLCKRSDYQKRVFGFLSERLQNVWMDKNKIKCKELPIYFYEESQIMSKLKSFKNQF